MYVLGIQGNFGRPEHDADAVIMKDGKVIAAIEEERLIRYKCAFGVMPDNAIRFCLKEAGIAMEDVDVLAFPRNTWTGHEDRLNWYCEYNFGGKPKSISFIDHHLAHAASSYLFSGFDESLILTVDMTGDGISTSIFRGKGDKIEKVAEIPFPNSLGLFMAAITQYLGFQSSEEEGKVMGLSVLGDPSVDISDILSVDETGYNFNKNYIHSEVFKRYPEFHTRQLPLYSEKMEEALPARRLHKQEILPHHANIAASSQKALEDAVISFLSRYRLPSDRNLCIAGGVAQNSVLNGKILETGWFDSLYVTPVVGDAGSALGAAAIAVAESGVNIVKMNTAHLGSEYSDEYIEEFLTRNKISFDKPEDINSVISDDLTSGKVVAIFRGKMEFGPRALGNRSILANPALKGMKDRVNTIKRREAYRPFAPSVLHEKGHELIDGYHFSPFMSITRPTTQLGAEKLREAAHIDGTVRYQSVLPNSGLFRDLIEKFYDATGIPGLLNTSMNVNGQPIVETPSQALELFFTNQVDVLALGSFVIRKG